MKYSEISKIRSKIMSSVEKSVDEMLDQLQANEQAMAHEKGYIDLRIDYVDVKLTMNLPGGVGSNGDGFKIYCNPVILIEKTEGNQY